MLAGYEDVLCELETEMDLVNMAKVVGDAYLSRMFCIECGANSFVPCRSIQ